MKKSMCILAMIIFGIIPIYFVAIWEPEEISSIDLGNSKQTIEDISPEKVNIDLVEYQNKDIKPILRISKEKIKEKLSEENKKKIKNIVNKLSSVDLNKMEEILANEEDSEAIKDVVILLKKRLCLKDYKEIQTILVPYINFDNIP